MYQIVLIFTVLYSIAECANYQRYEQSTVKYPAYTTIANLYDQNIYKSGTYGSDIASFPEATRYPNYNPGYSTNGYNTYSTQRSNVFYPPGQQSNQLGYQSGQSAYSTQRYGEVNSQVYGQGYSSYEMPFMRNIREYCINRSPQTGIWVDSLMGMWYGVEFIQHLAGDSRVDYARTCIVIHIAEPMERPSTENQLFHVQHINAKFRQEYRHLRLLWDEAGVTTEYSLYFKNDSAGYWQVFEGQNGTMAARSSYQQFSGSVQVLKAVNDHLVLNFCQDALNGRPAQLYSVLFSRDPGVMARWEIDAVHNMLQNKKLSVASRRMVCGNGADRLTYSLFASILSFLLVCMVRSF